MYLIDYHTHSELSMDGKVPLSVMAEHALKAGMNELCITDHCDLLDQHANRVYGYDWPASLEQYRKTVPLFEGRLKLKLGLEYGMGHLDPPVSDKILALPELDFVIGSVHNLSPEKGGLDTFYMDFSTVESCAEVLDDYFDSLDKLALTPYYDVIGHIIYPIRYMNGLVTIHPWLDRATELMRTAISRGKGIEVNTYRGRTVAEWKPILERYKALGGEIITVGSDAHDPAHVGGGIAEAYELLRELGFRYVTTYEKHTPNMIAI